MEYKRQAFYNTFGNLVYLGAQWLLVVLIVRSNGYEDAGIFSLAMSIANIFFCIAYYGMRPFQVSDSKARFSPYQYERTKYFTIFLGSIACGLYLVIINYSEKQITAIILYFIYRCFETLSDVYYGELQKIGRMKNVGISMSLKGILSLLGFAAMLWVTHDLNSSLIIICLVALILTFFYDLRLSKKWVNYENNRPSGSMKELLWECFPVMLSNLIPIIITAIPRILLETWYGETHLGYFSSIALPSTIIIVLVPNILLPFMTLYGSCYIKKQYQRLYRMFYVSIIATVGLGVIAWIIANIFGDWALSLVFGKNILQYSYLFGAVIISTTISGLTMCSNAILIVMRKSIPLIGFSAIALGICLLLGTFLIKSDGISGAIWTLGVAYAVQLVLQLLYMHKIFRGLIMNK